jgi:hypothetical protein
MLKSWQKRVQGKAKLSDKREREINKGFLSKKFERNPLFDWLESFYSSFIHFEISKS